MKKKIVFSLLALGLVVLTLGATMTAFPSEFGFESAAQSDSERTMAVDVAIDCRKFNYNRGVPLEEIVRGDGYIISGKIFPAFTLQPGEQSNDPNDPGSIGAYVERGTSTATLAEHLANPTSPAVFQSFYLLFDGGRMLVGEGWFAPSGANQAAVTGGVGAFSGATGETSATDLGTNVTGCPNSRFTIKLKKLAPK